VANSTYDLIIIGAGSAGLTAAAVAVQLGARTALIEKNRIGGDCTWTGCVPSKAILKAAKVAHEIRIAARYGITTTGPMIEMSRVREYVQSAIREVYQYETPEELRRSGIDVITAPARFIDSHTVQAGEQTLKAKVFLIATGAHAFVPPIPGLDQVSFITYERIFENERLPPTMTVIGAGPVGMEMAQAYQRFGSQVTLVDQHVLPNDEPEVQDVMRKVFEREGVRFITGLATNVRRDDDHIVVSTSAGGARSEMLLVASGRRPTIQGLDLEKAGVLHSDKGIPVDDQLRTNVKHIYAAGDVIGAQQFTHFAGWQAFQAVRNALLPGHHSGFTDVLPWVTYSDPEVAHVGLTEVQAREQFQTDIDVHFRPMSRVDRAVCENDTDGFIKLVARKDGTISGATIVAARAGETITEIVVAMNNGLKLKDLAAAIHAYPTYSTALQQLAAEATIARMLQGNQGRFIRGLSKIIR
jgi:pyruvate/2-oxoglutarate dehydrogenase complex dihydrolipoamide dehydrogenase (E3) component